MIFITVGTQAPFDRLIEYLDKWPHIAKYECFAQIADAKYLPKNIPFEKFLTEEKFLEIFNRAAVIISHAGMGTIISCLYHQKKILTLPRLAEYREHRNDHQMDTTKAFSERGYIYPIFSERNLGDKLDHLSDLKCLKTIGKHADNPLINFINDQVSK